jgi:putative transferase (TIGR04331 family)
LFKRALILTAREDTWPENNSDPVLFLGEWCKLYSRKSFWNKLDFRVVPYHWDNRQKYALDCQYINDVYEKLLKELVKELNRIHSVKYSQRYWRILIGPWLQLFTQCLYDRWYMLKEAIDNNDISGCVVLKRNHLSIVPNDMVDYLNMFHADDYNEALYSQLLEYCWPDFKVKKIEEKYSDFNTGLLNNKTSTIKEISRFKVILKTLIRESLIIYSSWTSRLNNYFFIYTYLGFFQECKLQLSLGQIPNFWDKGPPVKRIEPQDNKREFFFESSEVYEDPFENLLRKILKNHIPTAYLEGYASLVNQVENLKWPSRPSAIFTSNLFFEDDVFKVFAAQKTELGAPMVIGQHGGHYGIGKLDGLLNHQLAICDKFISWGWGIKSEPKITPIVKIKNIGFEATYNPNGGVLLVQLSIPRYSYHLNSIPISSQFLDYLDDQFKFVSSLPEELRQELVVRAQPNMYEWNEFDRWNDEFPDITFDNGNQNIAKQIKNSRVYISTYNATTFLESLSWNIPTIIFWNPEHSELSKNATPFFKLLKSVGIFHESPESAARHLTSNWNQIDLWWKSEDVQSIRLQFCNQYCREDNGAFYKIQNLFRDLKI